MIPQIIEAITKAIEGEQDVELDIRNAFPPEVIAKLERLIPGGEERNFFSGIPYPCAFFDVLFFKVFFLAFLVLRSVLLMKHVIP